MLSREVKVIQHDLECGCGNGLMMSTGEMTVRNDVPSIEHQCNVCGEIVHTNKEFPYSEMQVKKSSRTGKIIAIICLVFVASLLLGCAEVNPKPFEMGQETTPAYGCVELRKENPEADC